MAEIIKRSDIIRISGLSINSIYKTFGVNTTKKEVMEWAKENINRIQDRAEKEKLPYRNLIEKLGEAENDNN